MWAMTDLSGAMRFTPSPAYSEIRRAMPKDFDSLVLNRSLTVALPPYNAVESDIKPQPLWAKSSDISKPHRVSLN